MTARVLVVDDDAGFVALVRSLVGATGAQVVHAARAAEARALVTEAAPALVVVSGRLPDGDGVELIAALRAGGHRGPVVFVTATLRDAETLGRLLGPLGVARIVHKPVQPSAFARQLGALLGAGPEGVRVMARRESMGALRVIYAARLPGKLAEVRAALERARASDTPDDLAEARLLAHRLHGSAGTFGFPTVGAALGSVEEVLVGPAPRAWAAAEAGLAAAEAALGAEPQAGADGGAGAPVVVIDSEGSLAATARRVAAVAGVPIVVATEPAAARAALGDRRPHTLVLALAELTEEALALVADLRAGPAGRGVPVAFVLPGPGQPERRDQVAATHYGARLLVRAALGDEALEGALRALIEAGHDGRPHVVVVDDDPDFLAAIDATLRRGGLRTTLASSPVELVVALEAAAPDVLLIDVELPGASGLDLCRMLRATPRWQDLPILLMSADASVEGRTAAYLAGADDHLAKPIVPEELLARVRMRVERARLLRERLDHDALTALLLRRAFLERLRALLADASRRGRPVAVCMLDVDHFKTINDTHGHFAGDQVLIALGQLLASRFRAGDLRGRWGGDELVLALADVDPGTASETIARLRRETAALRFDDGKGGTFSFSLAVGVATAGSDGQTAEALLAVADARLLEAKRAGR